MSKSEVLYVRGMDLVRNYDERYSESDEEDVDIWDDKKLNDAYDKALKIANIEVAKRVAMSTNTQHSKKDSSRSKHGKSAKSSKKQELEWKLGRPCRAVYVGDGQEYEAVIVRIIDDEECVVRFLGYDNSEIVPINSLRQSLGDDERTRQIEQVLQDGGDDDGFGSQSVDCSNDFNSDQLRDSESTDRSKNKATKKKKSQRKSRNVTGFELPELPVPNADMLKNLSSLDMPMPPPLPATFAHDRTNTEEQAISSMLISWYMSGYYTGLYQGMKKAKENKRN